MTTKKNIIIAGFAGGAMPVLINIAKTLGATNSPGEFNFWTILGLLIFGIIGAAAAFFLEEEAPQKAFMMGISAPALITVLATSQANSTKIESGGDQALSTIASHEVIAAIEGPSPSPLPLSSSPLLYSNVAQSAISAVDVAELSNDRSLEISSETNLHSLKLLLHDDAGSVLSEHTLTGRGFLQMYIPSSCTSFSVSSEIGESDLFQIAGDARSITYVSIRTETIKTARAIQIFGLGKAISMEYKIHSRVVDRSPVGTEGWIYLGKRSDIGWQSLYVRFENDPGTGLPSVGSTISPTFPLNVRPEPLSKTLTSVLRVNQRVEVAEVKGGSEGAIWCRMKVVE